MPFPGPSYVTIIHFLSGHDRHRNQVGASWEPKQCANPHEVWILMHVFANEEDLICMNEVIRMNANDENE